jgi:patatin-like phospholipase/acyl hydrolase
VSAGIGFHSHHGLADQKAQFHEDVKPYIIVVFDGGGVRGGLQSVIMAKMIEILGDPTGWVDMFAGSSVGGMLGLAYSADIPPDQVQKIFRDEAETIFPRSSGQFLRNLWTYIAGPQYSNEGLISVLQRTFGDRTTNDLKTDTFVTTMDVEQGKAMPLMHFRNHPKDPSQLPADEQPYPLCLEAEATSAAPTIFDAIPFQDMKNPNIHHTSVDGGVSCNFPVLQALKAAKERQVLDGRKIVIWHIGTGIPPKTSVDAKTIHEEGLPEAAARTVNTMMEQQRITIEGDIALLQHEMGFSYTYTQANLDTSKEAELDNSSPKNIQDLIDIANRRFKIDMDAGSLDEFIFYAKKKEKTAAA